MKNPKKEITHEEKHEKKLRQIRRRNFSRSKSALEAYGIAQKKKTDPPKKYDPFRDG